MQAYKRGRIVKNGVPVRDVELTQSGWEYYHDALGGAVRRVARVVGDLPIIVTENGIATADDARRIAYTTAALLSLRPPWTTASTRGYFHWSMLDNWESGRWGPTFGSVAVDRFGRCRSDDLPAHRDRH